MKKTFISTFILLMATQSIYAANEADQLIQKAAEAFCKKGIEVSYTLSSDGLDFETDGKLLMDGRKFVIDSPEMRTWYDGKTQWTMQMDEDYSTVYIVEPTEDELKNINPYLLLNNYQDNFTAAMGKKDKGLQEIVLTAKDQKDIQSVSIWLKDDGSVNAMHIVVPQGQAIDIKVNSFRNGLSHSKNTFTIPSATLKKASDVVDMR